MTDNSKPIFVITIGRQFGSGGREIGRLVAQKLQIDYYDKELLTEAAKSTGMKGPENAPSSPRKRSSVQRVSLP